MKGLLKTLNSGDIAESVCFVAINVGSSFPTRLMRLSRQQSKYCSIQRTRERQLMRSKQLCVWNALPQRIYHSDSRLGWVFVQLDKTGILQMLLCQVLQLWEQGDWIVQVQRGTGWLQPLRSKLCQRWLSTNPTSLIGQASSEQSWLALRFLRVPSLDDLLLIL